ncbi:MBL fold metallo-hydrolase [Nocardioides litoris]|uniref:MBL fold metallo-hydrolase n=1 Tax=Nocardioides litoris TaxID=1926648 RepID=UPI001FECB918|nr:MBL fold metallo-hydrolase [Nocardioides litoris]
MTALLHLGPFTLLTDPNFLHRGQRAYLGKGLWSRRLTEPAITPETLAGLPALDAVLLSHLHGDHFDRVARRSLDRSLPVLTTPAAARRLDRWGFGEAQALRTWDTVELARDGWTLTVTSAPGVHGPGPVRHLLPEVMGSVLELREGARLVRRVYVSGDTLLRPWLREVVERCGPVDTAVLHLGGTRVAGVLVTMDGRQGADLVDLLEPGAVVPVHHDDYRVFRSPLSDFVAECTRRGLADRLRPVARGESVPL